jgi:hypothetical protein
MSLSVRLRSLRLAFKAHLPYVRRRQYRKALQRQAALVASLAWQAPPAHSARIEAQQPLASALQGETCLFVSHALQPQLKAHVQHHITQLLDAGIAVVLVINTDLLATEIHIPAALLTRLSGVLVRENLGFDFAAWAHAWGLLPQREGITRLYLANDSIVGPLSDTDFLRMLARMRTANADLIGLTQALGPTPHLQSYFLARAQPAHQRAGDRRLRNPLHRDGRRAGFEHLGGVPSHVERPLQQQRHPLPLARVAAGRLPLPQDQRDQNAPGRPRD